MDITSPMLGMQMIGTNGINVRKLMANVVEQSIKTKHAYMFVFEQLEIIVQ